VNGIGAGTTPINATSEGKTGTAQVVVTAATPTPTPTPTPPATVASVTVSPASVTLTSNRPKTLTAKVVDASDHVITGRTITWSSSDSSHVSVTSTGATTAAITALRHGTVFGIRITATCDGVSGTSIVTLTY